MTENIFYLLGVCMLVLPVLGFVLGGLIIARESRQKAVSGDLREFTRLSRRTQDEFEVHREKLSH